MQKRSAWKLPFISPIFFNKNIFKTKNKMLKFSQRNGIISKKLINRSERISVYSGKLWKSFYPRSIMLGLKLGEFCFTKIFGRFVAISMAIKAKRKKQDKKKK